MADEVMSGGSYYSNNSFVLHFGLGSATTADAIEVRWPSGTNQKFERVAGPSVLITEGSPDVKAFAARDHR
jgi:hypothetical protein